MGSDGKTLGGPDLEKGVPWGELAEGTPLLGHAFGEAVMLVRRGQAVFAIGATCTHYGGPLAEGLVVGETVRCPWHHACFSLRTGEPLGAPGAEPRPLLRGRARRRTWCACGASARPTRPRADAGPHRPARW